MRTAPATDPGGSSGTILRQLGIAADSYRQLGGVRGRIRAAEVRWHRRRLRKLLTPR